MRIVRNDDREFILSLQEMMGNKQDHPWLGFIFYSILNEENICVGGGGLFPSLDGFTSEIVYAIFDSYRNIGLGANLIKLLHEEAIKIFPDITNIRAYIKKENIASQKLIYKMGYKKIGEDSYILEINKRG